MQYNTSTSKFQFAEHQYEIIGNGGANSSETGIRDLFGWGTWLDGGNPINNSEINSDYTWDDTKKSAIGEEWVTLTKDEWVYLKDHSVIGVAAVDGKQGLVILPDDWTLPDGVTFNSGFADNFGADYYQGKTITLQTNGRVWRLTVRCFFPLLATAMALTWSVSEAAAATGRLRLSAPLARTACTSTRTSRVVAATTVATGSRFGWCGFCSSYRVLS